MGKAPRWQRYALLALGLAALVGIVGAFAWWRHANQERSKDVIECDSSELRHTVIVPTLDTPIPKGKSAIWCASFQLAWDRLKEDVVKGPVRIQNAEQVADRLNRGTFANENITPDSFYAAAGLARDGIQERIRADMGKKFPDVSLPPLEGAAVAFGYLKAEVKFDKPFHKKRGDFSFEGPEGASTGLRCFGLFSHREGGSSAEARQQVDVLYAPFDPEVQRELGEFALDLSKGSAPNQIVLARIAGKATLADVLADLKEKSAVWAKGPLRETQRSLGRTDTLAVPEMNWRLAHQFQELEGEDKLLGPPFAGLHLDTTFQRIDFKLDRQGAEVTSKATIPVKGVTHHFHYDRPFLIVMQKRGAARPFFVMWVANDELFLRRNS